MSDESQLAPHPRLQGINETCWCRGQGEALNIDRRDLYARLYACIPELALLPLQPDDGNLDNLLSQGKLLLPQTCQTRCILLVACIMNICMLLCACDSTRLACK